MTSDSIQAGSGDDARRKEILAALVRSEATMTWDSPADLSAVLYRRSPAGSGLARLGGAVTGQDAIGLLDRWIDQCRRFPAIVEVQRDLGVDAVAVCYEYRPTDHTEPVRVLFALDQAGEEYLVVRSRGDGAPTVQAGSGLLGDHDPRGRLTDGLVELVDILVGPPAPVAGARIHQMWPQPDSTDLSDEEIRTRYLAKPLTEPDRPYVRLLFVASLDGLASVAGTSAALSSPSDQRLYHLIRRQADALLIGAGTVRAERYGPTLLTRAQVLQRTRRGQHAYPTIAVVSRSLDLDPHSPLFTFNGSDSPPAAVLLAPAQTLATADRRLVDRAELLAAGDTTVDLAAALALLSERGHRQIVCEGGPRLAGQMIRAGLVDELCLTIAPHIYATTGPRITDIAGDPVPDRWHLLHLLYDQDSNLFLRYVRDQARP